MHHSFPVSKGCELMSRTLLNAIEEDARRALLQFANISVYFNTIYLYMLFCDKTLLAKRTLANFPRCLNSQWQSSSREQQKVRNATMARASEIVGELADHGLGHPCLILHQLQHLWTPLKAPFLLSFFLALTYISPEISTMAREKVPEPTTTPAQVAVRGEAMDGMSARVNSIGQRYKTVDRELNGIEETGIRPEPVCVNSQKGQLGQCQLALRGEAMDGMSARVNSIGQ